MLPPRIENEFLHYIQAFEKQSQNPKYIKVFDKIERPVHFKPVSEIPDDEIEEAWETLHGYLQQYQISLDVCSANITVRELYRFTTEELFEHEMNDMDIPGMMHGFIYDEFYPDHAYDNTNYAVDNCIAYLLQKSPFDYMPCFRSKNLRLNNHYPLSKDAFKLLANRFKEAYDTLDDAEIGGETCTINGNTCIVKGNYAVTASLQNDPIYLKGSWGVHFELDTTLDCWYLWNVQVEGISF
ncbi:hypothetical protein [Agriterribacter sp.]|uniref:hypothetical protein n=1 Tax=Agriterribacter sp. TaxID=2821509 RepID=UPI002C33E38D|nr:hypothetical protein [Agriterribacter sp.]HRO44638.1 hypothetical protein [Agriterribacter sp.]HRQ16075.1 hypothetical protein [Agriterribacter sp.]